MSYAWIFVSFLFLSLVASSQVQSSIDEEQNDESNDESLIVEIQTISLFSSLSSLFQSLDPFSLFDESLPMREFDPDGFSELEIEEDSASFSFWSFSGPSFIMFFWSSSPETPEINQNNAESMDELILKKQADLYLTCSVCEWLMQNVNELIFSPHGISELEFDALLRVNCFEWGLSRSYCDMLIYDAVPQMVAWIKAGNPPQLYCDCGPEGSTSSSSGSSSGSNSGSNSGSTPSDGTGESGESDQDTSPSTDQYSNLLRSVVIVLLSGVVFGMMFLGVRVFLYVRNRNVQDEAFQTLLESEEESRSSPPAYTDLTTEYGQPPKYAFSAQDAALMESPLVPPPQYSPTLNSDESAPSSDSVAVPPVGNSV